MKDNIEWQRQRAMRKVQRKFDRWLEEEAEEIAAQYNTPRLKSGSN